MITWRPVKRASSVSELVRLVSPPGTSACSTPGCTAVGARCAYRDRAGQSCPRWVCAEHGVAVGEAAFCPAHAEVVGLLLADAGSVFEVKTLPLVDDLSLLDVDALFGRLEQPLADLLAAQFEVAGARELAIDGSVREVVREHVPVGWERGWTVLEPQGLVSRSAVRALSAFPGRVWLIVDGIPVLELRRPEVHDPEAGEALVTRALGAARRLFVEELV